MKSLNGKLLLSAVGIALLATPAYAHKPVHHKQHTAVHRSAQRQQYAAPRQFANPPRYFLMVGDPAAPSGYSYNTDNFYYPGDY